jgi:hypothetical protein
VFLEEDLEPGLRFIVELEVEDEWENIINEQVSLIAKNKRPPDLLINELRTQYSGTQGRVEFIELRILSEGNLGGLRVFAASNSKNPLIYEFEPAEVIEDEYIVLHLRTIDGQDSADFQHGHNFWIPGSAKLLRKTDAVYVLDQNGRVLDAIMIAETPGSSWDSDHLAVAAIFLYEQDAWKSPSGEVCSPADAVSSAPIGSALTRSISRDDKTNENSKTAADWYVTVTNGATPGQPNDPRRI